MTQARRFTRPSLASIAVLAALGLLVGSVTATLAAPTGAHAARSRKATRTTSGKTTRHSSTAPSTPAKRKVSAAKVTGKLNLNAATVDQLQLLPGIGPVKAARVIEWRTRHRQFKRIKDLRRVKGFGRKTLDRLRPFLTLTEPTSLRPMAPQSPEVPGTAGPRSPRRRR